MTTELNQHAVIPGGETGPPEIPTGNETQPRANTQGSFRRIGTYSQVQTNIQSSSETNPNAIQPHAFSQR